MTQLHLKMQQPYARGSLEVGAVAVVRLLADPKGKIPKHSWQEEKTIAVEGDQPVGDGTVFELPAAGYYGVEIARPRGAMISREFLIAKNEVRRVTIEMESSPHEYLSWQQFAGIVPARPEGREKAPPVRRMGRVGAMILESSKRLDSLHAKAGLKSTPKLAGADLPASRESWERVRRAGRDVTTAWAVSGSPPAANFADDSEFATWFPEMPDGAEGLKLVSRLRERESSRDDVSKRFPRWVAFDAEGQIDLASVPWAWWGGGRRREEEEIRFVYDRIRPGPVDHDATGHARISVHDSRWFSLLEFMATDRFGSAAKMVDAVMAGDGGPEQALYGKWKGPLVAAAGAIVLVARTGTSKKQVWDEWLVNLANWFPGIPDGPILLGYRELQRARTAADLQTAYEHLREGIDRGIPFFSASIRLLSLALAQISGDLDDAESDRRFIASVSTRVDPSQPFTVIRL